MGGFFCYDLIMTITQVLANASKLLSAKKITSAYLDAEVLLAFVLKTSREKVLAHPERKLSLAQIKKFQSLISRRAKYEPVAYLIGYKLFYGLLIKVSPQVLIPRPETEQLVELVAEYATKRDSKGLKRPILDVGTGSGCICLALKKLLPQAQIWGLELSTGALKLARQNAKSLGLSIDLVKSDLLAGFKGNLRDAIIIANLPYLDRQELRSFSVEVKRALSYEPTEALFAGRHGLSAYYKLFRQINQREDKPEAIFIEIGSAFWRDFLKLTKDSFPQADILLIKDLCGKQRFIRIIL